MTDFNQNEFASSVVPKKDFRDIVAWVGDIPPMPAVASKALNMIDKPGTNGAELSEVLSKDPALTARVLKIANSAMFSRQRAVTSLTQAVMLIGLKSLKGIVVAATLRQFNKDFGGNEQMVWEHSLCAASCSQVLAKRRKKHPVDEMFLLSLLHSLGKIVILHNDDTRKQYPEVLKLIAEKHLSFIEAEQEIYGFSYPLIGALVAKKWNFSADTCQAILHHTDPLPQESPESDLEDITAEVRFSALAAFCLGVGAPPGLPDQRNILIETARYLKLDFGSGVETAVESLLNETQALFSNEQTI
jgi:HD-like signal output (HDOD) protein